MDSQPRSPSAALPAKPTMSRRQVAFARLAAWIALGLFAALLIVVLAVVAFATAIAFAILSVGAILLRVALSRASAQSSDGGRGWVVEASPR